MQPTIILYYDLQSSYSYLAFHVLKTSPIFKKCTRKYVPVFISALVTVAGIKPPWDSANKIAWIQKDTAQLCRDYSIPWEPGWPADYPIKSSTLHVQRILTVCSELHPTLYPTVLAALYRAMWVDKRAVQRPEICESVVAQVLGTEAAAELTRKSSSNKVKTQLKQSTMEAADSGVPGLPWLIITNEKGETDRFWGFDHLEQVKRFLFPQLDGQSLRSHL